MLGRSSAGSGIPPTILKWWQENAGQVIRWKRDSAHHFKVVAGRLQDRVSLPMFQKVGITKIGGVVQLVRTPACQAGGREFKSRRSRQILRKG
jgi:hypothetical protein